VISDFHACDMKVTETIQYEVQNYVFAKTAVAKNDQIWSKFI